jgi:hypothetical protein
LTINPYQSTPAGLELSELTALPEAGELADSLASLARWQTFFAFLGVIGTGLMSVALALQVIAVALFSSRSLASLAFSSLFLACCILLYGLPTWKLIQAVRSLRRCRAGSGSIHEVLRDQLSFWRTIGVILIVLLALYALAFLLTILVGAGLNIF